MAESKPGEHRNVGLSAEKAAELLGVSTARVKVLAAQGRLKTGGDPDAPRYDLDSVLTLRAENLIREMLEEAGDKNPKLGGKIDTLAMLQYQRGRGAAMRAEHWEMLERILKADKNIEAQFAEMRAMEEGRLRRIPAGPCKILRNDNALSLRPGPMGQAVPEWVPGEGGYAVMSRILNPTIGEQMLSDVG